MNARSIPRRRRQRGIALILVIGLVVFLSVIALSFSDNQRLTTQLARNTVQTALAQAAADGAVNRMVYELARPRPPDAQVAAERWKADGVPHQWTESGIQMAVSARSEAAKIDLNFAAEPLLKQLFVSAGASEEEADAIVAAVKDWTDADNLKRPNGAEADDYRAAGKKVLPANDFFVAVEELQNVMGVTPKIYNAVAPLLTVNSRSPGIDPQAATLAVMRLIPGIDAAQAGDWIAQRDAALRDGLTPPPLPFSSPYFAGGQQAIRIRADVMTADGIRASREASVRLQGNQRGRPQFYLWQRGLAADALSFDNATSTAGGARD
ncbi:MAG: general secretion pathway protein GspK [Burkholderiales bacterium]|nr:general secretion pathway protein GspK [Burkholderiales bacterium]